MRAHRHGWGGSGGVGARCSHGVGTHFHQWKNGGGGGVLAGHVVGGRQRL